MSPLLRIKRLTETAIVPRYQSDGAAGLDLHADLGASERIEAFAGGRWHSIRTGIAVEIPEGYEGQIRGRSGLAFREGWEWYLGTIDADYRGELRVLIRHTGHLLIAHGDRIGQLVIAPCARVEVVEADELSDTVRGTSGFGSSGK